VILTGDALFTGLLASLAIIAALALAALALPSIRWTRQLKRDSEIFSAMPDGVERERWAERVTIQATRLRTYEASVPAWDRSASWLFTALYVLTLILWLSGALSARWGEYTWAIVAVYCVFGTYVVICLIRGLPVFSALHPTYGDARAAMRQFRLRKRKPRNTRRR
jgi:hypothetical protein